MRGARASAAAALALALASTSGCGRSRESLEAAAVLHAIDALRNAPADATEARLARIVELEAQPAEAPLAKAARASCLKTYELMEASAALQTRVARALDDPTVVPATLASDVLIAEAKLKESAASMPACEEAQAALRRAFP